MMEKRTRQHQLKIYLTQEEKALFQEKMKLAKCRSMNLFLRKCVLEKAIYYVDLEPFRKIEGQLSRIASNINQIAKQVNTTGIIYRDDIQKMRSEIDRIAKEVLDIHTLLLKRGKE